MQRDILKALIYRKNRVMVLALDKLIPQKLRVCVLVALNYHKQEYGICRGITLVWLNKLNLRGKIL